MDVDLPPRFIGSMKNVFKICWIAPFHPITFSYISITVCFNPKEREHDENG